MDFLFLENRELFVKTAWSAAFWCTASSCLSQLKICWISFRMVVVFNGELHHF